MSKRNRAMAHALNLHRFARLAEGVPGSTVPRTWFGMDSFTYWFPTRLQEFRSPGEMRELAKKIVKGASCA